MSKLHGLLVTDGGQISEKVFGSDTPYDSLKDLWNTVGGYIEIVRLNDPRLPKGTVIVCDDEGLWKDKPTNLLCSALYKGHIVGDCAILKEGMVDGEPDLVSLTDAEISQIEEVLA